MSDLSKSNVTTHNSEGQEFRVQFTRRYDLFSNVVGNRPLNASHAINVTKSMRTNGALITPVIVNERMEIIDGQHRLYALEHLKKDVPFIMIPGYGAREMQVMNQTQKNWHPIDFMHYFAKKEVAPYVQLRNFMNDHPKMSLSASVFLLSPENGLGVEIELDGRKVNKFEFGQFEINNWSQGVYIASYLMDISEYLDRKAGSPTFARVIYNLVNEYKDSFSLDRFMAKLPLMASELRAQSKYIGFVNVINDYYWHNAPKSDRVEFRV